MAMIGKAYSIKGFGESNEGRIEVRTYRNNGELWLIVRTNIVVAPEQLGIQEKLCECLYDLEDQEVVSITERVLRAKMRAVAAALGDWRGDDVATEADAPK